MTLAAALVASCAPVGPPTQLDPHASIVFPGPAIHLVNTPAAMQAAKARLGDRLGGATSSVRPQIEEAVSHGESWFYLDRAHGESYRVVATPPIAALNLDRPAHCAAGSQSGRRLTCRDAHLGAIPVKVFGGGGADGAAILSLTFAQHGRQYMVAYGQLGRDHLQTLGATPGNPADGERFIASLRLDGQRLRFD